MTRSGPSGSAPSVRASRRRLEMYTRLVGDYEDARSLYELEPSLADEIAVSIGPLRAELERLEEAALFNGDYDTGDAVVTLQSGTGGTDAQDWTDMMLRMYERWRCAARLRQRAARDEPRRGGRPQERDVHGGGGERLRDPEGRTRQAPARAPLAVRLGPPAPDLVRDGDRRAAAARRRRRSKSTRAT